MNKVFTILVFIALITTFELKGQSTEKSAVLVGFNSTGSEFIFWDDNTYGLNVQYLREIKELGAGFSSLSFKVTGLFADGMTGGFGGLNIRVDEPFFFDFDALIGYSSITNADLLLSYGKSVTEYKDLAMITSIGAGYRFPNNV